MAKNTVKVRVRGTMNPSEGGKSATPIQEAGATYFPARVEYDAKGIKKNVDADVFEVTAARAEALGDLVEIVAEPAKPEEKKKD